jgi:hypothetical protein
MSSQPPPSTWKCGTCGTANRFANPTCVLCNNPRPANVAMPSGGAPSQLGGSLTQPGGAPGAQPAVPSPYGAQRPAPYGQPMAAPSKAATGTPTGIIVLVAYEILAIIYSLYNALVLTPANLRMQQQIGGMNPAATAPMKTVAAVGIGLVLVWIVARLFLITGFLMRWSWARVAGIIRYALSIASSCLGILGAGAALLLFSSMKNSMGRAPAGVMPRMPAVAASQLIVGLAVVVIALCLSIFGVWYLTTDTAKEYFSE